MMPLSTASPAVSSTAPSSLSGLLRSQLSEPYEHPQASQKLRLRDQEEDLGSSGTRVRKRAAKNTKEPTTDAISIGQGSTRETFQQELADKDCDPRSKRALWLLKSRRLRHQASSSPCTKPSNRVSKSTSQASKSTRSIAKEGRSRGAVHRNQAGSSQRVTQRTVPGDQVFYELDSHGVARVLQAL